MELGFLNKDDTALVVIDVQEKFMSVIFEFDRVVKNVKKLVEGFRVLGVPILVTEQYPKGLGVTVPEVKKSLGKLTPIEKVSFSCFGDAEFVRELKKHKVKNLVLAGIESHVCVLNTALDAISRGYNVHIPVDAVSSIRESDYMIAAQRLRQAGAFMASSEMLLFQMLRDSKQPGFRKLGEIIKKYG